MVDALSRRAGTGANPNDGAAARNQSHSAWVTQVRHQAQAGVSRPLRYEFGTSALEEKHVKTKLSPK